MKLRNVKHIKMDLSIYKTNSENEITLNKDYRSYLNSALAVTLFIVIVFCIFSQFIGNLFPITFDSFISIFFISAWFCIPFSLSFIYWNKFFDRKIKLLINENGIGYSSVFFDNLSSHKLKSIFDHNVASITSDGIGYKQSFIDWDDIIHYQFVIVTSPNKWILYVLELRIKSYDEPIIIYMPDKEIATFERVKGIIAEYAQKKGIKALGLAQKSEKELLAPRLHFQIFRKSPIKIGDKEKLEAEIKSEAHDGIINPTLNMPKITPLSNIQDTSVEEVSKVPTTRITPLSQVDEIALDGTKSSIIKILITIIESLNYIKKLLFPPKVIERLGDFNVKRGSMNGCLIALLFPFVYLLFGAITVAFPADLFGNLSEGSRALLMFLFQVVCIYFIYRIYSNWQGKILLRINMESISNEVATYYWKDISSFRYQIKFKSMPMKGGGYVNTVDHTNLQLYNKQKEFCGFIRIEMNGWNKTISEIRLAIFSVTDGHGIEDLGSEEDISEIISS